ncbi:MAG: hypothetical protein Q7R81_00625 [Candidatus Peregrinibacteria bacterium]|nr:hypothetical protein [Candidatus Peregrinibacteria bacterium]
MKRALLVILPLLLAACGEPAVNPDPNHTHADFAVWVDGQKLDFSGELFMSGSSKDEPGGPHENEQHKHPYFHLHDGVGHVIHRHKPGLTLGDFFGSLPFSSAYSGSQLSFADSPVGKETYEVRLFVNGTVNLDGSRYVFNDDDHLLITNATQDDEVTSQLHLLTDDSCLYSRTCPERGDPPAENCIADPEVPCVVPEGDL